ncbi:MULTISPECIES: response regulator transcription factor [unclassified Mesorhizobium]|jgi:DNA-binding response OmpR family regulator|uniref:response regulator transcription factor n=1 Tax=unclassified Mesorhizobium TaxID=325217 RepID=UPI000FD76770|nr:MULTISPECIES: response regulator transcription factor [unclassified Mesorhizobium]RWL44117.1 MAG: response regulator transcription factor [Mesorhizobium sp.]TGQ09761.1 response regulator transcription factor [Mesorhizobium sp. M2E.F.Ca.ET.219.01.1.1]TGS11500.1 response regulator transcription factor [Mesorhizobium sp. M2E.F.Ca.ET.209.01.1.1]TGT66221.1 response regulator transcription factor [Mesorhizobium sp. M2E.F.Ca.ET.166.01.1.1]TGV97976.1 response regulator transcription factor [Mesorhi
MAARSVIALVSVAEVVAGDLAAHLDRRGHDVRQARQPWEAETLLSAGGIDVVVVGDEVTQAESRELLKRYSSQGGGGEGGPDFILICRPRDLVDKVLALELGAADVIESPLNVRELAARIGGLLMRRGRAPGELIVLENATVDLRSAMVMHRSGAEDQLSPGQVALLKLFLASPRKVLTRDDIIAAAPAENADAFDRSIDSRIVRLRRKLDTDTITTIRGAGYRFDPPASRNE